MPRPDAPKKRLGQHFLTEKSVSQRIAALADGFDAVLEIGPGRGALTEYLVREQRPLCCVEADGSLAEALKERFEDMPGVSIVHADFLKWEPPSPAGRRELCIGNLPYYITTPIIERFIGLRSRFACGVFMVQKEVADRLLAVPGTRECGAFGLYCRYYCETVRVMNVSRGCFFPAPKVDSSVIRMEVRSAPSVECADEDLLFGIIRAAYGKRRKTLANSLSDSQFLWWGREMTCRILKESGIDPSRRGENLSLEEFALLADAARNVLDSRHRFV